MKIQRGRFFFFNASEILISIKLCKCSIYFYMDTGIVDPSFTYIHAR